MARIYFLFCRRDQLVEQIIRLNSESLSPANSDEGLRLVFFAQAIAKLGRAAWSQHDHSVREVREMVGSFPVPQITQRFLHRVLCFRLSHVDDVVVFGDAPEVRMVLLAVSR